MMYDTVIVDDSHDVVKSPDDDGWYLQRFPDHAVSEQTYRTMEEAIREFRAGNVTWKD